MIKRCLKVSEGVRGSRNVFGVYISVYIRTIVVGEIIRLVRKWREWDQIFMCCAKSVVKFLAQIAHIAHVQEYTEISQ